MSSPTINFDFLSNIGKLPKDKFKDQSKIKPVRKLNTESFHNVIYKVKQHKELLEQDINRMEQWHQDFKENDLWNTPQSAIVESILKYNAQSNPGGNISRFLQTEKEHKEKEEMIRISKRFDRPMSAYANLSKSKTPLNARSVQDFFVNVENDEETIEEIIGARKHYKTQYESNKRKITEKINNFVDNTGAYNTLLQSTSNKNITGSSQFKASKQNEGSFKDKERMIKSINIDNLQGQSINEIVESYEEIDSSPRYRLENVVSNPSFLDNKGQNETIKYPRNRPFSAKVGINTALTPKSFASGIVIPNITQKIPSAIHTRPQTAKNTRFTPNISLTNSLVASGEIRQQSVPQIKFIPFMMEGQKMHIEPYNINMQKLANHQNANKESSMREDKNHEQYFMNSKIADSTKQIKTTLANVSFKENTQETSLGNEGRKFKRPMTAKPSLKTSAGTQTLSIEGPPVGKVNIDGEYFQAFSSNKPGSVHSQTRKNVLESWTSKDNQPQREI